jgi:hypothetical protein
MADEDVRYYEQCEQDWRKLLQGHSPKTLGDLFRAIEKQDRIDLKYDASLPSHLEGQAVPKLITRNGMQEYNCEILVRKKRSMRLEKKRCTFHTIIHELLHAFHYIMAPSKPELLGREKKAQEELQKKFDNFMDKHPSSGWIDPDRMWYLDLEQFLISLGNSGERLCVLNSLKLLFVSEIAAYTLADELGGRYSNEVHQNNIVAQRAYRELVQKVNDAIRNNGYFHRSRGRYWG